MATIVLQAAGAFLGGLFGPVGAAIGRAAGALVGYSLDRALIDSTRHVEGPRLASARAFTAEEGASIPRVYGAARLGGTLVWATRFEEVATTRRQGGKGGARVTDYSYFANAAFVLCEGEIAGVRRVWADGREIDRTQIEMRLYRGTEDQDADPLIAAKQGEDNAPAYRGVAYVVLERFPVGDYGNRLPQFQFEVLRPVGSFHGRIRSVVLIPGATEYGLSPDPVTQELRPGETVAENRHVLTAPTDIAASLDELQALCPNLESVSLVVTWFGDDLRAGHCRIRPAVTAAVRPGLSQPWLASGLTRSAAAVVSTHGGGAAFGGSPSDHSVMAAIAEIRRRGLKVTLYPLMMMDIPAGNALPDPSGAASQPAYPWRGRITCDPAPGVAGSADKTAAARGQVAAFCGTAASADFAPGENTVLFTGSPTDWGYRRFVLHFAHLAVQAGGVDGFLVGSELRGLTTLRDDAGAFPFVEALCTLADEAKTVLGGGTAVTYGADWSEYFGHHPADGSGDVLFHLDPLWARPSVAAVGIDNYMPLSDWRDEDVLGGSPDAASGPCDAAALRAAIAGGEGFDWYYASDADRRARARATITDGAYEKPWVFRYKDLVSWWSQAHVNRLGGAEMGAPSAWAPQSKPIWFTELGCPAVDKGANQPNVFPDAKSSENALPYFSGEGRDDLAQRRFLAAHLAYWDPASPDFAPATNPVSAAYGGRMVDPGNISLWSWDARPFTAFPQDTTLWSDGPNWFRGHWLNGRLEAAELGALINAILADHGIAAADVAQADGMLPGYVVADPGSAREALEPLVDLFGMAVTESAAGLRFAAAGASAQPALALDELVFDPEGTVVERAREPDHELPAEASLSFTDPTTAYQSGSVRTVRPGTAGHGQAGVNLSGVMEAGQARQLLAGWLDRAWTRRETAAFSVASYAPGLEPGALVRLPDDAADYQVTAVEDGLTRRVSATRIARVAWPPWLPLEAPAAALAAPVAGAPQVLFLDLPSRTASAAPEDQFRVAAWRKPWRSMAVLASPEAEGFSQRASLARAASLGVLEAPLAPGFEGRFHRAGEILVLLYDAEAASVSRLQLLNGANAAAVRSLAGAWEILQFEQAEEVAPGAWRLSGLLRGQLGTTDAMLAGAAAGADLVLLDEAVAPAGLRPSETGLPLNWRVGPTGSAISVPPFAASTETGGVRARLPLAPVHVKARLQAGGDVGFTWIRRGRLDADDWTATEIPLGEETESYRIDVGAPAEAPRRSTTVALPAWTYSAAAIAADFGAMPAAIEVAVSQLSAAVGWGLPAVRRFDF